MEKYCSCCGQKKEEIIKKLKEEQETQEYPSGKKYWGDEKHKVTEEGRVFDKELVVRYCGNCGKKLKDSNIKNTTHAVGKVGLATARETIVMGYKCEKCGYEAEF